MTFDAPTILWLLGILLTVIGALIVLVMKMFTRQVTEIGTSVTSIKDTMVELEKNVRNDHSKLDRRVMFLEEHDPIFNERRKS